MGFRQLDHTADLALEFWAPTEAELLCEGARAVVAILTEQTALEPSAERTLTVDAIDREDRLVQWLNEIIYAAVTVGFITTEAKIRLGDTDLVATLYGEPNASSKIATELKSVTYHDLSVVQTETGWRAHVVIDV